MSQVELEHPWMLLALLALPLYAWWRWRSRRRDTVFYAPLQHHGVSAAGSVRRSLAALVVPAEVLLLTAAIVGVAGLYRVDEVDFFEEDGVDVLLVLDISLSMLATDFPPDRLTALRRITRDFIHRSGGNRLGVLVFAKDAFVHSPLTTDRATLLELLDGVQVEAIHQGKSGGTAIGDALLVAAEQLRLSKVEGRDQALVLITDGESNEGVDPRLAGRYLRELGVRFYAIGIGSDTPQEVFFAGERVGGDDPYMAVLDAAELEALAQAAAGVFYRATEVGTLEALLDQLSRLERAPLEVRRREFRHPYDPWLGLAALVLLSAHLTLGGLVARRPLR